MGTNKSWAWLEDDFEVIRVLKQCIPADGKLVEAYETETEIIVCGEPPREPEGLSEAEMERWYETSHNCDAMGCGTLSHVIYRLCKDDRATVEALRRVIHTNECSDEAGWFAYWSPGEFEDENFAERVNGCESEAQAVEEFLRQEYSSLGDLHSRVSQLEAALRLALPVVEDDVKRLLKLLEDCRDELAKERVKELIIAASSARDAVKEQLEAK